MWGLPDHEGGWGTCPRCPSGSYAHGCMNVHGNVQRQNKLTFCLVRNLIRFMHSYKEIGTMLAMNRIMYKEIQLAKIL